MSWKIDEVHVSARAMNLQFIHVVSWHISWEINDASTSIGDDRCVLLPLEDGPHVHVHLHVLGYGSPYIPSSITLDVFEVLAEEEYSLCLRFF